MGRIKPNNAIRPDCDTGLFHCSDCNTLTASLQQLEAHSQQHHPESFSGRVECQKCKALFFTAAAFERHCSNWHQDDFFCLRCHTFYDTETLLRKHLHLSHQNHIAQAYFCGKCGLYSKDRHSIAQHMNQVHGKMNDKLIVGTPLAVDNAIEPREKRLAFHTCLMLAKWHISNWFSTSTIGFCPSSNDHQTAKVETKFSPFAPEQLTNSTLLPVTAQPTD